MIQNGGYEAATVIFEGDGKMYRMLKLLGLSAIFSLFLAIIAYGVPFPWGAEKVALAELMNDSISYWKFDEGSGSTTVDSAAVGNKNDGSLINGPQWVTGISSNALKFNPGSGQYVQAVNNGDSLSIPSGGMSIAAWIKPDDITGEKVILAKDKFAISSRGNYFFAMMDGNLEFGFSPQPTGADVWIDTAGPVIIPNKWSFVAVTFIYGTGEKPIIYVDGRPVTVGSWQGSGIQANAPNTYPDPLYIGRSIDAGWFFGGVIDEVKLYDRVLTPEEIALVVNLNYLPIVTNTN